MTQAKVLVVEDERVVAMHLRQQLSRLGYNVPAMATAGKQALQQIQELLPDVVLMDIHIEGDIDGIETAARIPPELHIPVIYLTAYSEEATLERARLTKPYGYLLKPFSERELHAAIQMVLERRKADNVIQQDTERLEALVSSRTAALVQANRNLEQQTADRLSAERALHQVQKMDAVGQLTGGVAHDFNNLMQVVIGNLSVVVRILPEDQEKPRTLARKAMSAAQSAAVLTQRLLAFSRRQPLAPKPIDVNGLLNGMSDLLKRALGETVTIETFQGKDLWLTEADPNQLESMILNLVINSRDAMTEGGWLTIETQNVEIEGAQAPDSIDLKPGSYVVINVSDTGHGMSKDILARVFEPFFTTKEVGKGTGLGLSQVYGFVKQSGGHVRMYSEEGRGTTAKIYLPRYEGVAPIEIVPETVETSRSGCERILVVEDEAEVRAFSTQVLRDLGYDVIGAANGPEALELLRKHQEKIDLLFTDVVLPAGMDGAVLAAEALRLLPDLKVLFTTGYARNAIVHHGRVDPGIDLITKPFTDVELASRIRHVLDRETARTLT
jgi:signal transduction histidine kinase